MRAEPGMSAQEAVRLGDVHPGQQVRVRSRVRPSVRGGAGYVPVDSLDSRDRLLGVGGLAERRDREEVAGPLQPPPGVAAVIRVLGHRGHGQRMQRLEQQGADPADEHRRIPLYLADRTVLGEPALAPGLGDPASARRALRPRDALEDGRADPAAQPVSGPLVSHLLIITALPSPSPAGARPRPPWLISCIAIFVVWLQLLLNRPASCPLGVVGSSWASAA